MINIGCFVSGFMCGKERFIVEEWNEQDDMFDIF